MLATCSKASRPPIASSAAVTHCCALSLSQPGALAGFSFACACGCACGCGCATACATADQRPDTARKYAQRRIGLCGMNFSWLLRVERPQYPTATIIAMDGEESCQLLHGYFSRQDAILPFRCVRRTERPCPRSESMHSPFPWTVSARAPIKTSRTRLALAAPRCMNGYSLLAPFNA